MSEKLANTYNTIPVRLWTDPDERQAFETYCGTPLGNYSHRFESGGYSRLLGLDAVGEGVVVALRRDFSEDPGFRVFYRANFDNPDGTFSSGYLLFGAATRVLAEKYQEDFVYQLNTVLEGLGADVRLAGAA